MTERKERITKDLEAAEQAHSKKQRGLKLIMQLKLLMLV